MWSEIRLNKKRNSKQIANFQYCYINVIANSIHKCTYFNSGSQTALPQLNVHNRALHKAVNHWHQV